jgi:hypothetical protein
MTTLNGYMDGSYDYKHMYNITDLKGPRPYPRIHSNSILGFLNQESLCTPFVTFLKGLRSSQWYNDPQMKCTLFVPLTMDPSVYSLSPSEQTRLLKYHTLDRPLSYTFLRSSGRMKLNTRLPVERITVTNTHTSVPLLNGTSTIVGAHKVGDSCIYFIDTMLMMRIY